MSYAFRKKDARWRKHISWGLFTLIVKDSDIFEELPEVVDDPDPSSEEKEDGDTTDQGTSNPIP